MASQSGPEGPWPTGARWRVQLGPASAEINQPAILWSAAAEGFCSFSVHTRRGGGGHEIGPCRAPSLASCSWLGWLFSFALSHDPAVESGPHSLASVFNGSSVTSLGLGPDCCTGCRCPRVVRHLQLSWLLVGWWLRRRERGRRVGVFCLKGVWLSQYRFTSARFIPHFVWRKMWCGCVGSSRLEGLRVVISTRGTEWSVFGTCSGCVSTSFRGWGGDLGHRAWQL